MGPRREAGEFFYMPKKAERNLNRLRIRDAVSSDREAIREVTLSAYQEYAALIPSHWEDYRRDILATLANVKPAEQIIAEQEEIVIGAVLLYPAGTIFSNPNRAPVALTSPEVRLLAVSPAWHGHGVGGALMGECVRRARRSGAAVLTLHTTDMMRAAVRLYERMGFMHDPELDFQVDEHLTVKGYRLNLDEP